MNKNPETKFTDTKFRVRYAETDQMGHAYYANYLIWFEVGRGSFCLKRGISYLEMERKYGTFLPVVQASCRYRRPLIYDQEVLVRTRIIRMNRRGVTFEYQITDTNLNVVHAEGMTKHVFADENGKPKSISRDLMRFFE